MRKTGVSPWYANQCGLSLYGLSTPGEAPAATHTKLPVPDSEPSENDQL